MDITEQNTHPLDIIAIRGAVLFQAYLDRYHLHPLDVSLASGVRYLTIWNMQHGNPVTRAHALQVREGLRRLTGVPFTVPLATQASTELENRPGRVQLFRVSHLNERN